MPQLSIILTVYNTEPYLGKCLDSILSQSYGDFELICVDNHSTDHSADILRAYALLDQRIGCYSTLKHGRAAASRDFGLQLARGKFITYVDSDDSLKPDMYSRMFREQQKYNADIVVCNYDLVYPERVLPCYSPMNDEVINVAKTGPIDWFYRYFCMGKPNNYLWSRIIRREIPTAHQIGFHPVGISEDSIFTMLCSLRAGAIAHIGNSYYCYWQRDDSTVRETVRQKNIAQSFVHAFTTVQQYAHAHNWAGWFQNLLPMYAFTRMRSILFYLQESGCPEQEAYRLLRQAIANTSIPSFLRQALSGKSIERYAEIHRLGQAGLDQLKLVINNCLRGCQ
jgi:glycosyltransferase involved in cell wall biosynthesis